MFTFEVGSLLNVALILGTILTFAALLIWVERRLLGFFNDRLGPNRVGPFGILQSVADVIKLITKEDWVPPFADKFTFVVAPVIIPIVMLLSFAMIPFAPGVGIIDLNIGLLFIFAMAGLASYSAMLGGIASNNKFSLLGGLRAAGQAAADRTGTGSRCPGGGSQRSVPAHPDPGRALPHRESAGQPHWNTGFAHSCRTP